MRVVSLARDTPTGPPLHPYQISNYLKQYGIYGLHKTLASGGDDYIMKTMRVVSLACDAPTGPPLHSYQILSKYVQGYRSCEAQKDASTDRLTDRCHADRYIPEPIGRGIKTNTFRAAISVEINVIFPLNGFILKGDDSLQLHFH